MRNPSYWIDKIRGLLKIATLRSTDDSGAFRFGQIGALGKTQTANIFSPYGLIHHPPDGSMAMVLIMQGEESKSITLCDDPKRRIKGLSEGEVGIANYLTQTHFIMKENGDWDIQVNGNVNMVVTGNVTATVAGNASMMVTGTTSINSGQDVTITSGTKINLNAPQITWQGGTIDTNGVTVNNGDVTVNNGGNVVLDTGDVTAETISLKGHVHTDVTAGGDDTGAPKP